MDKLINKADALINKVLKIWDIKDLNLDSIDPIIRLLIACVADESGNLERKINETTAKVEQILLDSLLPYGLSYSKPAHAIIQALPSETVFDINERQQYVYDKSVVINGKKEIIPLIFSPVGKSRIFRASVEYIYNGETLFSVKDNNIFNPVKIVTDRNSTWIGLSVDESVKSLENFSFYISTTGNLLMPEEGIKPVLIDRIRLFVGDQELNLEQGIGFNYGYDVNFNTRDQYSYDLLAYNDLLKDSFCSYSDYLFKISEYHHQGLPLVRTKFPEPLGELFDKGTLNNLVKNLLWLEFRIDSSDPEVLKKVNIVPNAFPVINIKPVTILLTLDEPIKKIPLGFREELVGVVGFKAFDEFHNDLHLTKTENKPFLLRDIDMEKFSATDSLDLIEKLIKRFESDYHAFHELFSIDDDQINKLREAIKPIQTSISTIKAKPNNHSRAQYLIFKPEEKNDMDSLEVDCVITNGAFANNIPHGERLKTSNSLVKQDSILFVNRSRSGRDRLSADEKRKAINYMMISNNQLITQEDIRGFCYFELGDRIKSLSINDSVINGPSCLRKCMKINIVLDKSKTEFDDIPLMTRELENKIRLRSIAIVPIIVNISCV